MEEELAGLLTVDFLNSCKDTRPTRGRELRRECLKRGMVTLSNWHLPSRAGMLFPQTLAAAV